MNEGISEEQKSAVLESLTTVGERKCIGFLPLYTLEVFLGRAPSDVKKSLERKGLAVQVFLADECCIKSGAIYAYHHDGLKKVLKQYEKTLIDEGWPIKPRDFVERIAHE